MDHFKMNRMNSLLPFRPVVLIFLFVFSLISFSGTLIFSEETENELIPAAVWTAGEVHVDQNHPGLFDADKMLDGNPETYACLLDTTRTGSRPETFPPNAEDPVTAEFVLDLGQETETVGIRFVSPNSWRSLCVRNVTLFACDDLQGTQNLRLIRKNVELPPCNSSYSVCVTWEPVRFRCLLVKVNRSYQLRSHRQGVAEENYFNTQIAEVRILTHLPTETLAPNPNNVAFPLPRLQRDWILQDFGPDVTPCFRSTDSFGLEKKMVDKVLDELEQSDEYGNEAKPFRDQETALVESNLPGSDPRWKELYFNACEKRRLARLSPLLESTDTVIYTKHFVFGGTEGLTGISHVTDEQYYDATTERRAGSQLCRITIDEDGRLNHEVLLDKPNGLIRDPNLSWDAQTLVFSMRDSCTDDDYHLYVMNLADSSVRQITFSPEIDGQKYPCADFEPCFTATGDLLFASTRHIQINDCWPNANTDIYTCTIEGKNIRRLTYDELDVNYPQVMKDGRVLFTRWEYSDRNAYFLHPLMTMNPDGTMQTEYCGNNSMYPSSYIQARPIPDSTKVIAIISGHHVPHKGKLALIDRTLGTQDGKCIEYVAGSSPDGTPGRQRSKIQTTGYCDRAIDFFGQSGPQYQYPCPLDEEHYLVAYCPEGWATIDGPYLPPFGIYFMTANGERELLAFDWTISCGQPVAVMEREKPIARPSQVNFENNFGTFLCQDIYYGPGLANIPHGTIKKLRVVALEYRAGKMGKGSNAGEADRGLVQTPVSYNNGSWDVKHVLGEVDIEEDGSVAFQVPARTPVYFQLLDERGYCVQTMRSWSTLQSGERFACLGCHEDKLETGTMHEAQLNTVAANNPPQIPRLVTGELYPLIQRLQSEIALDSVKNYLGVNAPDVTADPNAPADGFSYIQKIQPILDRHCVRCHSGETDPAEPEQSALDLRGYPVRVKKVSPDDDHKRNFTQSYIALTNGGKVDGSQWVQWLEVRSRSEMLPPYHTGSCKSPLMKYLEPEHYQVQVSDQEKRTVACWIDLLIPFCGSYTEANSWTPEEKIIYLHYLKKRLVFADLERREIQKNILKKQK